MATTVMPARMSNICVNNPNRNGPMKAVAFPEKAKNPKNSFSLPLGINLDMRDRLEDWFGPEKIPISIPENQNNVLPDNVTLPIKGKEMANRSLLGTDTAMITASISPTLLN